MSSQNQPVPGLVSPPIRLGTRGSPLARWQAEWVADRLRESGAEVVLEIISTSGDVRPEPLTIAGGQGLFTKEIQRALLEKRVDLAVHSLKDLPTEPIPGLVLAAVPERERSTDVLVARSVTSWEELPAGACVGTGSRRRQAQLWFHRPDLQLRDIRGNVETRLKRLDSGEYDAIILAEAGLKRLGLGERITQVLPPSWMLPAIGQGALGLETRADDERTRSAVGRLDHAETHAAVLAERALLAGLRAGCLAPVGAWCRQVGENLHLTAAVFSSDGRRHVGVVHVGHLAEAVKLGANAAQELLALGAESLIAASHAPPASRS